MLLVQNDVQKVVQKYLSGVYKKEVEWYNQLNYTVFLSRVTQEEFSHQSTVQRLAVFFMLSDNLNKHVSRRLNA